jgi:hypothetical protein
MRLSEEVRQLLLQGNNEDALADLAAANPRALRPLVGRRWDPDREIRRRAARVVGQAAAANTDLGAEVIRRLMWTLNDESATNGVHAIPALGEIGRRAPDMLAPHVPALVSMSRDGGIRLELLAALTAVAESAPQLIAGHLARLETTIDGSRREERQAFRRLVVATERRGGDDD